MSRMRVMTLMTRRMCSSTPSRFVTSSKTGPKGWGPGQRPGLWFSFFCFASTFGAWRLGQVVAEEDVPRRAQEIRNNVLERRGGKYVLGSFVVSVDDVKYLLREHKKDFPHLYAEKKVPSHLSGPDDFAFMKGDDDDDE